MRGLKLFEPVKHQRNDNLFVVNDRVVAAPTGIKML